ncbi:hypothetical protein [Kribbella sp. NBC_00889]|uniref:hypothetical protein n=1 Tax=Kribbella sp. NBC_00889 TaxID=2975974 RepID=UPI00386839CF|nr:cell wall-active antibiotics response protein [Kribbella sp. NBC_00889]
MKWIRPVLLGLGVVVGIAVGFGLFRKYAASTGDSSSFAMFGETKTKVLSENLTDAAATAVFGAVTLDLRDAHIDDEATVDTVALFGGVEVLIPRRWRLALSGTPVFGGVEDKTTPDDNLPVDAPVLNVSALAVFGGVAVANEPGEVTRRKAAATAKACRRSP